MRTFRLRTRRPSLLTALSACACLLLAPAPAAADPTISLTPSQTTVDPGDTAFFTIDINIADALDVYGWQLDVSFDPAVINILSTTEGAFLTSGGVTTFFIPGTLDNGTGLVDNMAASRTQAVPGVDGDGLLASLFFQVVGLGSTPVALANVLLVDSAAQLLTVGGLVNATVTVNTVVPEPGTGLLVLSGLGGLAAFRRKRRKVRE